MCEVEPGEATEVLDAVRDGLANRNRVEDKNLVEFWAKWLENHAAMLRELDYEEMDDDSVKA